MGQGRVELLKARAAQVTESDPLSLEDLNAKLQAPKLSCDWEDAGVPWDEDGIESPDILRVEAPEGTHKRCLLRDELCLEMSKRAAQAAVSKARAETAQA